MQKVKRLLYCKFIGNFLLPIPTWGLIPTAVIPTERLKSLEIWRRQSLVEWCKFRSQVSARVPKSFQSNHQPLLGAQTLAHSLCKEWGGIRQLRREQNTIGAELRTSNGQTWAEIVEFANWCFSNESDFEYFFNNLCLGHEWKICTLLYWRSLFSYNWVKISLPATCLYSWQ